MKAIILAGGRGSRLQPWHAPKCLLPINGVSILQRLLRHLALWPQIDETIICTGYRAGDIEAAVYASAIAQTIGFSHADGDASMGARLMEVHSKRLNSKEQVLICYGDELADVDVARLLTTHDLERNGMTFSCSTQRVPGGSVDKSRGRLRIVEDDRVAVNIGFVVVEPECWPLLEPGDGLSAWMNRVGDKGKLGMYLHGGKRATVNSLADLAAAEEVWT